MWLDESAPWSQSQCVPRFEEEDEVASELIDSLAAVFGTVKADPTGQRYSDVDGSFRIQETSLLSRRISKLIRENAAAMVTLTVSRGWVTHCRWLP